MIAGALQAALRHHQLGRLEEAAVLYRQILTVAPEHVDALHLLGVVAHQQGKHGLAVALIGKAIARQDTVARFHNNLGEAQRACGQRREAAASYRRAAARDDSYAAPHYNLGNLLLQAGQQGEAEQCYRHALSLEPKYAEAHNNLGTILMERGDLAAAGDCYRRALALRPSYADAHNNLGVVHWRQGDADGALQHHFAAAKIDPASVPAHTNLAMIYQNLGNARAVSECYGRVLALQPDHPTARLALGDALYHSGEIDEALACYVGALAHARSNFGARWRMVMARLRIAYADTTELERARAQYAAELSSLVETCAVSAAAAAEAAEAVGALQPFYLASQARDDRELQSMYGGLVTRVMADRYPQWSACPQRLRGADEPLRIGIVSGFFYRHSVWKIPIRGWIEGLDRNRFRLFGYHTRWTHDDQTDYAERCLERFVRGPLTLAQWAESISGDALDVLLYPDIGQDPISLQLAALRLAPVQCVSFGHPDTTGLPTIDYYLSSVLMEPDGAERHYTERLVRLPNLGIYYASHYAIDEEPSEADARAARTMLGVLDTTPIYWCCQAPHKYRPEDDDLFPLIATRVPHARFVFIDLKPRATYVFRHRLNAAFASHGLQAETHCVFLPVLDRRKFAAMTRTADVFLDSIGWSGFNTALDALACNLPIVTLPGAFMRGRHAAAVLTMAGVTETIAASKADYVTIAARLALDPQWRTEIAGQLMAGKTRVYRDLSPIRAMEEFLLASVSAGP